MSGRLLYVMGPSGAGKDSLIAWLRQRLAAEPALYWSQRTIDRPRSDADAQHEAVSSGEFAGLHAQGRFALCWQANGQHYGVRHTELLPLQGNAWVVVNGSRAYLPELLRRYPTALALHITAPAPVLRQRLLARGRDTPQAVEARVQRALQWVPPAHLQTLEFCNDGRLDDCGRALLQTLQQLPDWPPAR